LFISIKVFIFVETFKPHNMTTNELVKELNRRGYVAVLFNHETWCVEGEQPIPIRYVQSQVETGFYHQFDELYGDVIETIINDDFFEDYWD
jgi:hypothetical protein